jgi:spermidine/putrescine transport system permease protein
MNRRVELNRGNRIFLACVYWAFVLYVFVPLILMIVMGFKDSKFIGFPIRSWTLDWYTGVFSDAEVLYTFGYSVVIASLSTLISVIVGTWIAVLLEGRKFWGRAVTFGLMVLPALVPGIISAIAFRIYARMLGVEPGMGATVDLAQKPDRSGA